MILAKVAICGSFLSGSSLVVAQSVPGLPAGFKDWPATAVMGFICLVCLSIVVFKDRMMFRSIAATSDATVKSAEAQTKISEKIGETNTRLNELAQKHGETNQSIGNLVAEMKAKRE